MGLFTNAGSQGGYWEFPRARGSWELPHVNTRNFSKTVHAFKCSLSTPSSLSHTDTQHKGSRVEACRASGQIQFVESHKRG